MTRIRDGGAVVHVAGNWFYHWIIIDFIAPIWPNIAASALLYVLVRLEHVKTRKEINGD